MSSRIHQSLLLLLLLAVFPIFLPLAVSQSAPPTPPAPDIAIAPSPALEQCEGIFLQYDYLSGASLYPYRPKNNSDKAYSFRSLLSVLNAGIKTLKSWEVFVGFQHEEILVSMTNAVIADGSELPADLGNNGTTIAGYPLTDLKTAIATAGDLTQIEARVEIVGTEFGVASPVIPMPANITLVNDGWQCPAVTKLGNRTIFTCCTYNQTVVRNITDTVLFLPRQSGDINIDYDVIQTYTNNYLALVTISNENPLGRLDHWKLSWEWMRGEFIKTMRGAYTLLSDASDCLRGPQATQYADVDFTSYMNCQRKPTIVDFPLTRYNDTNVGQIEYCCRNGTILPSGMDSKKAKSAFQLQVFKMPPDLNRTVVYPPQNFMIVGDALNPTYKCGPPVRVAPTVYPDPSGLLSYTDAIASWRVVCNITKPPQPKCCVSFSAYFNDSVVPCRTCACGCPSGTTCSASATAMLLPSEALLVPFANRTAKTLAWAAIKHYNVPNPLPCGDNCGVSINWHVYTDYTNGWSARITLFNWGDVDFADWFVTAELAKALPGFQAAYSFNGTSNITGLNDTLFMQGLLGLNYLIAESKDNPGKQQSVISFNKKLTPGINVATGDGFPTKMYFNGQECSMPTAIPTADSPRSITVMSILSSFLLALAVYLFVMDQL